jgi:hypothetical protein
MTISITEVKFMIKLVSVPPVDDWYDIRDAKDGTTTRNLMSVVACRLKNGKKLIEFAGHNRYRPTAAGWAMLKEFHDEIAISLTKIFEKDSNETEGIKQKNDSEEDRKGQDRKEESI